MVEALVQVPPPRLTIHGRWWYQERVTAEAIGPNEKPEGDPGSEVSFIYGRTYPRRPVLPAQQMPPIT